ncbi:MAG TPA: hypothetical protein VHV51_03185 [Polyangiaceae bacterium]|jgi:hypothetical protein|nr:hypothetical protein [Polyangiaceae bacterium]
MGERSLASIFSKLDRNQEADWLAERIGVQRVLSKVLGVPLDDLRGPTTAAASSPRGDVRRLRLTSLRYARALDLLDEPLCPGIPHAVLTPGAFESLFWRAPSGSGRSLVGRFLEARGLAQVLEAQSFDEALSRLPERGPVFIELHAQRGPLPPAPRGGLCVAGDFEPGNSGWNELRSAPVEAYLSDLVAWIAERLPADGRFDRARTLEWLRDEMLDSGALDGLGAALGLCGLADELGVHTLQRKSLRQIAERFCRDRLLATLDPEATHAGWLRRNGYDALVGLGRRLLADSDAPWDEPRALETWLELVPHEHQREPDLDWMRLSLSQADSAIRPSDIEKAARKIPPGAFRIVRALQRAELLRDPVASGRANQAPETRLALGPRWFSSALRREATEALVSSSAQDFGEALLRGHAAPSIARELVARLSDRGGAFIDNLLELESADSVGHAAAVDMTFRAAGVALLAGAELAPESLEALWDEVIEARLELPGELPCPRIEYEAPEPDALLTRGIWYLAAFAVTSELGQRAGRRHALLRPWKAREASPDLAAICRKIAGDLPRTPSDRPWVLRAFSLIARLRAEIGALGNVDTPELLERPGVIVDEVAHGVLTWSSIAGIDADELGLEAVQALAKERSVPFASVARAIWEAWDDAQRPSDGAAFLAPDSPFSSWFWPHVPSELLEALLCDARATKIPYESFADSGWQAFLRAIDTAPARAEDERAFLEAPDDVLATALERGVESRAFFASLWRRVPERAALELEHALAEPSDEATPRLRALLEAAPPRELARVFATFSRPGIANTGPEKLCAVRRFLHDYVRARKAGYVEAYARLAELERKLALGG